MFSLSYIGKITALIRPLPQVKIPSPPRSIEEWAKQLPPGVDPNAITVVIKIQKTNAQLMGVGQ
jgi:hypothetical protein